MPRVGKQDVHTAAQRVPLLKNLHTEVWELPGAELLHLSFEIVEEPAEELIPPALHPSIPSYITLSIARYPQSPVGPFSLAQVRVVARAGIRPRGYLLGAYTNSEKAAAELRARWGFTIDVGTITLDPRHDQIIGRVQQGRGGHDPPSSPPTTETTRKDRARWRASVEERETGQAVRSPLLLILMA